MDRAKLAIDAFDPRDHGLGAQLSNDRAEMLQVIDLKIDREFSKIGRAPAHADIVDIAVVLGDHGRNLRQAAGLIDVVDQDSRRKTLRRGLVDVPTHVEPALRLLLEVLQGRRLDRIDGNTFAGGDDADNAVAGYRTAVRREFDRQTGIIAADRDGRWVARRFR